MQMPRETAARGKPAPNLPAMVSPSSSVPSTAGDTATPPPPPSSTGANSSKPFPASATGVAAIRSPMFSAQPLIGKPINSPSAPHSNQGILYPVGASGQRGFSVRAAASGRAGDQLVTVANPAGYLRNSSPVAVMNFAAAMAIASQSRPYMYSGTEHAAAVAAAAAAAAAHGMRPPPPQGQQQAQHNVPLRPVAPRAVSLPTHPKVPSLPAMPSAPEQSDNKERDKSGEDAFVMIHGRKVRLVDGGLGSLYALCRSWIRNGLIQETHPNIGDGVKLLPKPLPPSIVDEMLKKEDDMGEEQFHEEYGDSVEQLSSRDLLAGHIKRAKRVRARLRRKRLLRIERYKQRLSLLLPAPNDLGQTNATPGS